jgi:hypothetical protein
MRKVVLYGNIQQRDRKSYPYSRASMSSHKAERRYDRSNGNTSVNTRAAAAYSHWRAAEYQCTLRHLVAKPPEQRHAQSVLAKNR